MVGVFLCERIDCDGCYSGWVAVATKRENPMDESAVEIAAVVFVHGFARSLLPHCQTVILAVTERVTQRIAYDSGFVSAVVGDGKKHCWLHTAVMNLMTRHE